VTAAAPPSPPVPRRVLLLVGVAIVLTGLNLRTAVNSVGPVLQEIEDGLGVSSAAAGVITTLPVLCFAAFGFAGPPLAARFRDGHVLAAALLVMALGLLGRAAAGSFALFLLGTAAAMTGGALGNVMLPSLVKRWFPTRTGLLVSAYGTAMAIGGALASGSTAAIAGRVGEGGWRWALGVWAVLALVAVVPWLAVPARPVAATGRPASVRMRSLLHSRLTWAMIVVFGLQSTQAYIIIGWTAQYLRDQGMSASSAGLLVGLNAVISIPVNALVPPLAVRQRLQRPLLVSFVCFLLAGWSGLALAPLTATWVWVVLLGLGLGTFAMVLTLMGLRARTPESTAALSTVTQGVGYVLAAAGPLLVGVLRGSTGGYTGMFVVVFAGALLLLLTGWGVCRERYVDDEVSGLAAGSAAGPDGPTVEVAGAEPAVVVTERR
jgi:CP family cyanate transporter-like MFS transporter